MRTPRIHLAAPLQPGRELALDERGRRYTSQVLRLRRGDPVVLFNGDGTDYAAVLLQCDRRNCRARVGEAVATESPAALEIDLAIGISRGERMDFAIQKAVELGVCAVTPLHTERSLVQLDGERLDKRLAHWRGVIVSACEQSGRSRLPDLAPPCPLDRWLAEREPQRPGLLLHHAASRSLAELPPPGSGLDLLVGPEGGLSEDERQQAIQRGLAPVRLGPRVLRTETAPLAALAAIQVLWGDLR